MRKRNLKRGQEDGERVQFRVHGWFPRRKKGNTSEICKERLIPCLSRGYELASLLTIILYKHQRPSITKTMGRCSMSYYNSKVKYLFIFNKDCINIFIFFLQ